MTRQQVAETLTSFLKQGKVKNPERFQEALVTASEMLMSDKTQISVLRKTIEKLEEQRQIEVIVYDKQGHIEQRRQFGLNFGRAFVSYQSSLKAGKNVRMSLTKIKL